MSDLLQSPTKGNGRSSGYERHTDDWYVEPRHAIDALLDAEPFKGTIWDPACGGGNIVKACCARGLTAYGSDIADRGFGETRMDFLTFRWTNAGNICVNPPFKIAVEFTLHALTLVSGKVAVLQRTPPHIDAAGRCCCAGAWRFSGVRVVRVRALAYRRRHVGLVAMTDARPFIAHDFSEHSGCCVLCGLPEAGAPMECVPTTAEPEVGE